MTVLINPGSQIGGDPQGWSNTAEQARKLANEWLDRMRVEGFVDIELTDDGVEVVGRWQFVFRHTVTGAEVVLETHGIDNMDAYLKQHTFPPRVYWNGSSCAEPDLDDFAADGFSMAKTYRAVQS